MGCINSSHTLQSHTREIKIKVTLTQRIITYIQSGNLKRLKALITDYGVNNIDFTEVQGHISMVEVDDQKFATNFWTPVLLALAFDQYLIAKYFLEDLKLNPAIYLIKPKTQDEIQIEQHIKKTPNDKKEQSRYKVKLEKYNRVISIVLACKHQNAQALEYLIDSNNLKYFWSKTDLHNMIHFVSNHSKIWEFAIPIIMGSHLAHRWFFQEKEINKVDVFYRLQRHFNIKILLDEMFHQLQDQLTKPPYSAAFFISFANQEFVDDKVPELSQMRECLNNIIQFDFTMINEEINYFPELKDEICTRFPHVESYKALVNQYNNMINVYTQDTFKINQDIDQISIALMRQDLDALKSQLDKNRIENVNQINLRVSIPDYRFRNTNLLSYALHNNKPLVIDFLLENDLIDLYSCSKRSPTTLNQTAFPSMNVSPQIDQLKKSMQTTSNGPPSFQHSLPILKFTPSCRVQRPPSRITDFTPNTFEFNESKGFNATGNLQTLSVTDGFYDAAKMKMSTKTNTFEFSSSSNILPLEILIEQKHKDLFLKFWDKFIFQFTYHDFSLLLGLINADVKSEDWYKSFLNRQSTKYFFEKLPIRDQMDFIDRIMTAFDYCQQSTNDLQVQDLDDSKIQQIQQDPKTNTFHLLKPCTLAILREAPYVSVVFLNCFINFKKDKCYQEHIVKGSQKVNYRQKIEFYLEYEEKFQGIAFNIFKEQNSGGHQKINSISLSPYQTYKSATGGDALEKVPLMKVKSEVVHNIHDLVPDTLFEQFEKIYEVFYSSMVKKEFLLPHQHKLLDFEPLDI